MILLLLILILVCLTVAAIRPTTNRSTTDTYLFRLAIYSCRSGDLQVICLIVMRHTTYHHRVLIWTCVCMLTSCFNSHWDLQVSVEPLNSIHQGVCCDARLTCIFTFWRITALVTLILSKVERWSKIAKMVLAIRTILDLVYIDLSKGLWAVFKVASSRTCHEMCLFGQCTTVLSDIEFLHWLIYH